MIDINLDLTKNCQIFKQVDEMLEIAPRHVVNNVLSAFFKPGIKRKEFGYGKRKFSINIEGGKITVIIDGKITKTHIRIMIGYLREHSPNVLGKDCTEMCCPLRQNGTCRE